MDRQTAKGDRPVRRGRFGRTLGAALAATLAIAIAAGGVASGRGAGITAPIDVQVYLAGDPVEGDAGGTAMSRERLVDADGDEVGTIVVQDTLVKRVAWTMSAYLKIKSNASIEAGTITVSGLFRGFNGETLAVTGGTGAYENVRGTATLSVENDRFTWTLHLIP